MSEVKAKYRIDVEIDGVITDTFYSNGQKEILYEALLSGVDLPSSCEVGFCESCSCKYEGEVGSIVESMVDGNILTCKSYALSDLILKY